MEDDARLAPTRTFHHIDPMTWRDNLRAFFNKPIVEILMFVLGVVLILLSPIAGAIPGPGGIFVFAAGLALVLKTSMWAKRYYVRFKRKQPKVGRWADWGLRRQSPKRREERLKAETSEPTSLGD